MKAIDVLRTIDNLFLDCHYPLRHVVLRPDKDSNYTVGELIKDTLREDAILTSDINSDGESAAVYCAGCGFTHRPGKCPDGSNGRR